MIKKIAANVTAKRKKNCKNLFVLSQRLLASRLRLKTVDPNNYKIVYMGDSWASAGNFTGVAVLNEALNVKCKPQYQTAFDFARRRRRIYRFQTAVEIF